MLHLGKDIISIIMKMKKEMEYIDQEHKKLLQIANDTRIHHILSSYTIINREIVLSSEIKKEKDVGYIPFYYHHLAMKWIDYVSHSNNNYSSICINIKPVSDHYTTQDLKKIINSFYHMKAMRFIYLDGFDDVCQRENTFEEIRDALEIFLNQNEVSIRFYMEEDKFIQYNFDKLRDITIMDEFWD